jgi:hypothetical protein
LTHSRPSEQAVQAAREERGGLAGLAGLDALALNQGPQVILYEKSFDLKTISQGDFGHVRENNQIILSKVATIALRDCF